MIHTEKYEGEEKKTERNVEECFHEREVRVFTTVVPLFERCLRCKKLLLENIGRLLETTTSCLVTDMNMRIWPCSFIIDSPSASIPSPFQAFDDR
jgi:hypothetical protein